MTAVRSGNTSAVRRRNWIGVIGRKLAGRRCRKSALRSMTVLISLGFVSRGLCRGSSNAIAEDGAFIDRALGIELARKPRAADHMHRLYVRRDFVGDAPVRLLAGADDEGIERQDFAAVGERNVQSLRVDPDVTGIRDLAHTKILQFLTQDPARALAERAAEGAGRALHHGDFSPRRMRLRLAADAPALEKFLTRLATAIAFHGEEEGNVMADAAAADDHDAFADLHRAIEHLGVSDDARIVAAGDVDEARRD